MTAMTGYHSKMKKKFLLRVDESVLEDLRKEAKYQEISLSQLLRDILDDYVNHTNHRKRESNNPPKKVDRWWH